MAWMLPHNLRVKEAIFGPKICVCSLTLGKKADAAHVHIVAKQLVKGCLTLVMYPTSLLQQSLVDT